MNFAEMIPQASDGQVMTVLLGGATLMGIALLAKQLFWPDRGPAGEFATKGELKELETFVRERTHSLSDAMHAQNLRLEVLHRDIRNEIDLIATKIQSKLDATSLTLTRVVTILENRKGIVLGDGTSLPPGP